MVYTILYQPFMVMNGGWFIIPIPELYIKWCKKMKKKSQEMKVLLLAEHFVRFNHMEVVMLIRLAYVIENCRKYIQRLLTSQRQCQHHSPVSSTHYMKHKMKLYSYMMIHYKYIQFNHIIKIPSSTTPFSGPSPPGSARGSERARW